MTYIVWAFRGVGAPAKAPDKWEQVAVTADLGDAMAYALGYRQTGVQAYVEAK